MWWALGIGWIVYLSLYFTLGLATLRNGRVWMFFFGIFIPAFWLINALTRRHAPAVVLIHPAWKVTRNQVP